MAEAARPFELAASGERGRANQSRGVDVVSPGHRRWSMPGRRYLVADGDRHDFDIAFAWRHSDQARLGNAALTGRGAGSCGQGGQARATKPGRISGHSKAVAGHAPDDLWG